MQINKNQVYEVEIISMTSEGNGVAKIDNFAIFIPNVAIGDIIKVKIVKLLKSYAFGRVEEILTSSSDRIAEDCDVFNKCGGCCFRHINYQAELKIKQQMVEDCFKRIGGFDISSQKIAGSQKVDEYRNKAQFPIGLDENGNAISGFYANRSHRIISCKDCKLQPSIFNEILQSVLDFINENNIPVYDETRHRGLVRHLYIRQADSNKDLMLTLVLTKKGFRQSKEFIEYITKLYPQIKTIIINYNPEKTNVILGDFCKTIFGDGYIVDEMCDMKFRISPLAFYQVNRIQAQNLYNKAIEYAEFSNIETVLDLYCGIGTIGISGIKNIKKLYGVEVIPQAIEDAKMNASLNDLDNAEFFCGDCKDAILALEKKHVKPDVIIVDPPRKGCDNEVIDTIVRLNPSKVVMISCNPATAARDCKLLCENGYKLQEYTPFDLFPRTRHVETVCLLSKLNVDHHIEVELNMDELDLTSVESKATYAEIKEYVMKNTGLKVSSLYIAQVKDKMGIKERENFNVSKKDDAKVPVCPADKEKAIIEALEHFNMID